MNGKVKQNNEIFKTIFGKVSRERTEASANSLVARASILTNSLHGSSFFSSFWLLRGYAPSVAKVPLPIVPHNVFEAQIQLTERRACQRALQARKSQILELELLSVGTVVWMFYDTSKQNDPKR